MSEKQVHSGHRNRVRERAINEGLDGFNPHQILEFLLFYPIPRQDTSVIAHLLIDRFGSVYEVLKAPIQELVKVAGVGRSTASWLHSIGDLVDGYASLRPEDIPRISNFQTAFEYCEKWKNKYRAPQTFLLCMTPSGGMQAFFQMCDSLNWYQPEILKKSLDDVLSIHARNVIVLEFMDGEPEVTEEDCKNVENYAFLLRVMGVELLDIIKIGSTEILSLNQDGYFDRTKLGDTMSVLSEHYLRENSVGMDYGNDLPLSDEGL